MASFFKIQFYLDKNSHTIKFALSVQANSFWYILWNSRALSITPKRTLSVVTVHLPSPALGIRKLPLPGDLPVLDTARGLVCVAPLTEGDVLKPSSLLLVAEHTLLCECCQASPPVPQGVAIRSLGIWAVELLGTFLRRLRSPVLSKTGHYVEV